MAVESESIESGPRADPQVVDGLPVDAVALTLVSVAANSRLLRRLGLSQAGGGP